MPISVEKEKQNPYVIGRPIYEPEIFFGRESLFSFIEDNLRQGSRVVLLHGQRRIGKSSVLSHIPNFVKLDDFLFCSFDLQDQAGLPLSKVLLSLAQKIFEDLDLSESTVQLPKIEQLDRNSQIFSDQFLASVFESLKEKKIVLLLDEFDVLGNYKDETASEHFFPYLKSILRNQNRLFIIPVIGRRLNDLENLLNLFREAPHQEVGLLDEKSTARLITKPAEGVLDYKPEAIQAVFKLSAGHPYFTQVICFSLFRHARERQVWTIDENDVEDIIDEAIESGEAGLTWFRDGLPVLERVIFSAVAEIQKVNTGIRIINLLDKLNRNGLIKLDTLFNGAENLVRWGFLTRLHGIEILEWEVAAKNKISPINKVFFKKKKEDFSSSHKTNIIKDYKVKIDLVSYWLQRKYPLSVAIWELEDIDPDFVRSLYDQPKKVQDMYSQSENLENINFSSRKSFRDILPLMATLSVAISLMLSLISYGKVQMITLTPVATPTATLTPNSVITPSLQCDQAIRLVESWLNAKGKIFAKPFDMELAANLTTGSLLEDIPKSIEFLKRNNSYFSYESVTVKPDGGLYLNGTYASMRVIISQATTYYKNGSKDPILSKARKPNVFNYKFEFVDGKWKIYDYHLQENETNATVSGNQGSKNETNATIVGDSGSKNVRSGAGTIYDVVGTINTGDRVQILSDSYDLGGYKWFQIYHPASGISGWIASNLINPDDLSGYRVTSRMSSCAQ